MLFSEYYELICAGIGPELKTFASIDVPDYNPSLDTFRDTQLLWLPGYPPVELYRYMAYLRHAGFPSPLLDWSQSPFVAAFFAFRDDQLIVKSEKRRIYAYCERPTGGKGMTLGQPFIHTIGPYVQTHHRHFRQRSTTQSAAASTIPRSSGVLIRTNMYLTTQRIDLAKTIFGGSTFHQMSGLKYCDC